MCIRKILFINIFLLFSLYSLAQKGNNNLFSKYEKELTIISQKIINGSSEKEKQKSNKIFTKKLIEVLQYEQVFDFPFDSLSSISRLTSPDNSFRIFTWSLKKDNNYYEYYGLVHYYNKNDKRYKIIPLTDNSNNIHNVEQEELDATNWYGGLYYEIIYIKNNKNKYYTLLGWDGNDGYSTKKIIDIIYFSNDMQIKFGLPLFSNNNQSQKRVILEYDSKTSVSVKYHKNKQSIIFNHLVPPRKDLKGAKKYYVPDGSFNSYNYEKGKWVLKEDVDARNGKIKKRDKKTRR